jgi:uridine kinase
MPHNKVNLGREQNVLRPLIVGVAGGSGSGKTTIAKRLMEFCPDNTALLFQLDHYYRDLAHLSPESRDQVNFDHPDSLEMELVAKHLSELSAGKSISRPSYEFASHTRSSKEEILEPKRVIIVDGIFSLYSSEVRRYLDCGIYVDVSDDVRFIRRLKRDVSERGRTIDSVIKQYLATVKPMYHQFVEPTKHLADVVVSWDNYNERTIQLLGGMIKSHVT